jgi:hypothetical protein
MKTTGTIRTSQRTTRTSSSSTAPLLLDNAERYVDEPRAHRAPPRAEPSSAPLALPASVAAVRHVMGQRGQAALHVWLLCIVQSYDWIPPDMSPWGCVAHAIPAERHCASSTPVAVVSASHLRPPPPLPPSPPQQPPPGPSSTHLTTLPVHSPATSRNTHRVDILDAASERQQ